MSNPLPDSILVEQAIGDQLQAIWSNPLFSVFCHRDFLAPDKLTPGTLLFVGINPSYTEADAAIRYYDAHAGNHPYFRAFKKLAAAVQHPWSHLDLLYQRETEQKAIDQLLAAPNGLDFVWQQLQLSRQLLDAAQPAVIIVCNTKAREFLGLDRVGKQKAWLGLDFQWDEKLGTYRHQGIPVFFTSMLSGQRALDTGSYQRLVWHVKRALALG